MASGTMEPGKSGRKNEARRYARQEASGRLKILWEDGAGEQRMTQGRIVNVSVEGVQVLVEERIPVRSYVYGTEPALGIRGRASVRYCNFSKGKYQIGLEFSGGSGWKETAAAAQD
jgi:hypothetical protein